MSGVVAAQEKTPPLESLSKEEAFRELEKFVRESRHAFNEEFVPIKNEITNVTQPIHHQLAGESQIISTLKNADGQSLDKVRNEIQNLIRRISVLERVESVLSDMDPGAIEQAIKESEANKVELHEQIRQVAKPLNQDLSEIHREHKAKSEQLKVLVPLLLKSLEGTKFAELKQKHPSVNFIMGTYHCRFVTEDELEGFTLNIDFNREHPPKIKDPDLFNDVYPITYSSNNSLTIDVNGIYIKLYATGTSTKPRLAEAMNSLVDLDTVSRIKL